MLDLAGNVWHQIFAGVYLCGLAIFCVLRELIFAIRTDWFSLLRINFAILIKYLLPCIHNTFVFIVGLQATSRRPCWWCVRINNKKHFSPLGTKPYFHVSSWRKNYIVLMTTIDHNTPSTWPSCHVVASQELCVLYAHLIIWYMLICAIPNNKYYNIIIM